MNVRLDWESVKTGNDNQLLSTATESFGSAPVTVFVMQNSTCSGWILCRAHVTAWPLGCYNLLFLSSLRGCLSSPIPSFFRAVVIDWQWLSQPWQNGGVGRKLIICYGFTRIWIPWQVKVMFLFWKRKYHIHCKAVKKALSFSTRKKDTIFNRALGIQSCFWSA